VKLTVHFARCKKYPESPVQFWIPHLCCIYSECQACNAANGVTEEDGIGSPKRVMTGYTTINSALNYHNHYLKYQIIVTKQPKESYESSYDRAEKLVNEDPMKYLVTEWSDPVQEARHQRMRVKESKHGNRSSAKESK